MEVLVQHFRKWMQCMEYIPNRTLSYYVVYTSYFLGAIYLAGSIDQKPPESSISSPVQPLGFQEFLKDMEAMI